MLSKTCTHINAEASKDDDEEDELDLLLELLLELELELDELLELLHILIANSILVMLNTPVESADNSPISNSAVAPLNVRSNEVPDVYGASFPIFIVLVSPIRTSSIIPSSVVTLALIGLKPSAHTPTGFRIIAKSAVESVDHSLPVHTPSSADQYV